MLSLKMFSLIVTLVAAAQIQSCFTSKGEFKGSNTGESQAHPRTPDDYLNVGKVYIQNHNYSKAVEAFKQAVLLKPNYAEAYYRLGESYHLLHTYQELKLEHPEEEVESYKKAIELDPNYAEADVGLANTYLPSKPSATSNQQLDRALALYRKAIEIKPDYMEAYRGLGAVYIRQDRDKEAIEIYRQVVSAYPDEFWAYGALSDLCIMGNQCSEAIEIYQEAMNKNSNNFMAHWLLGRAYFKLSRYSEAADAYKEAARIQPGNGDIHYDLGSTYIALKNKDAALEEQRIIEGLAQEAVDPSLKAYYKSLADELSGKLPAGSIYLRE